MPLSHSLILENEDLGNFPWYKIHKLQIIHNQMPRIMHLYETFVIFHRQHVQVCKGI